MQRTAAEMQSLKLLFRASGRRLGGGSALIQRRLFCSKPRRTRGWPNRAFSLSLKVPEVLNVNSYHGWKPSLKLRSIPLTSFFRGYGDLPEHKEVKLPALSPTMSTGTIVSWEKQEGEEVMDGDVLAQVETDKATMDMDSPQSGFLAKIIIPAGTKDIPLGKLVCIIVDKEADIEAFKDYQAPSEDAIPSTVDTVSTPAEEGPLPVISQPTSTLQTAASSMYVRIPSSPQPTDKVVASPYARKLAAKMGIDLKDITGTGMDGRIVSHDIQDSSITASGAGVSKGVPFQHIELSGMRKTIARRLQESKRDIPHFYLTVDVSMDKLLNLRQQLNELGQGEYKLTLNDFLIKACAAAMSTVPEVNSSWEGDHIRQYSQVDISMAVSTDRGLVTPIIFGANTKGLLAISTTSAELAERARDGKLQPNEFQGGTFTISNLGMYGIKQFTAIINPPQACILAVGSTEKRVIVDENSVTGFSVKANIMTVTLSCDHRVVDGTVGAKWLTAFKMLIESPYTMLL